MNQYRLPPLQFESRPLPSSALGKACGERSVTWMNLPEQWKRHAGEGVLVVMLDTGVPRHRDLHRPLFSFNFSDSNSKFDLNSHQTQLAGIIGGNNRFEHFGWAPKSTLAYIKVLDDKGTGKSSWIERGIRQATQVWRARKKSFLGCVMCLAFSGPFDADHEDAIIQAEESGITIVAAARTGFVKNEVLNEPSIGYLDCLSRHYPGASNYVLGVRNEDFGNRFSKTPVDILVPHDRFITTAANDNYQVVSGLSVSTSAAAGMLACAISSRPNDKMLQTVEGMRLFLNSSLRDNRIIGSNRFEANKVRIRLAKTAFSD